MTLYFLFSYYPKVIRRDVLFCFDFSINELKQMPSE